MDYPGDVVSNQKKKSTSIQRALCLFKMSIILFDLINLLCTWLNFENSADPTLSIDVNCHSLILLLVLIHQNSVVNSVITFCPELSSELLKKALLYKIQIRF